MRIGFDAKRYFNNYTGLGVHNRALIYGLWQYAEVPINYFFYTPRTRFDAHLPAMRHSPNVHLRTPEGSLPKGLWRSWGVSHYFDKDKLDIFHGLSHDLPFGNQRTHTKKVVTIHDVMYRTLPHTFPWTERLIYSIKYTHSFRSADMLLAVSEQTKRDILFYGNVPENKVEVLYTSMPFFEEKGGQRDEEKHRLTKAKFSLPEQFILSLGTVEERKNLELTLRAYTHIPPTMRLPLVVVGGGGIYKKQMRQLAVRLGVDASIFWIVECTQEEVLVFLQRATLLVYPSHYEGFGLPLAEALFCRLPVVAARTSSLPEAGGAHSIYVHPKDERELAEAIVRVLDSESLRETMKQEGYAYAKTHFSAQGQARALVRIYERLLGS